MHTQTMLVSAALVQVSHDGRPTRTGSCLRTKRPLIHVAVAVGKDAALWVHRTIMLQSHVMAHLVAQRRAPQVVHMDEVVRTGFELRRQFVHEVRDATEAHFHDNSDNVRP